MFQNVTLEQNLQNIGQLFIFYSSYVSLSNEINIILS